MVARRLPMMSNVEMLLKKQINILQMAQGENSANIKLLFPSDKGSYQSQNSIRKRFVTLQKKSNISEIKNIHFLRHTFVINALNAGVSIQNLCGIIGHGNGATTLKFYAHYLHTEARKQLFELDKFHEDLFHKNPLY